MTQPCLTPLLSEQPDPLLGKNKCSEGDCGNAMDAIHNALRHRLKLLSTEKSSLQSHLLECRLKIKQEGKAYQKAYDERRAYLSEIAKVSSAFDWTRKQQLTHIQKPTHNTGKGAPVPQKHDIKAKRGAISTFPQTRLPRLKR
ncbi:coiled-coil domain-containing protein 169 [Clarias gariepinus]